MISTSAGASMPMRSMPLADSKTLISTSSPTQKVWPGRLMITSKGTAPGALPQTTSGHRAPLLLPGGEIGTMWLASLREENLEGDRPAQQDTLREQALAYTQAQLTDVAVAQWEAFSGQKGGPALSLPRSTPVSRSPR